jgi:hypothetical protein
MVTDTEPDCSLLCPACRGHEEGGKRRGHRARHSPSSTGVGDFLQGLGLVKRIGVSAYCRHESG